MKTFFRSPLGRLLGFQYLQPPLPQDHSLAWLRRLIYLYGLLWIIEGALRKWIFPQLSEPLLLIRDPLVLVIYAVAFSKGALKINGFIVTAAFLSFAAFGLTMMLGHGNLLVAFYGVRTAFLHIPLIFVMGRVFDRRHVCFIARWTLIIALPMIVLITLQFISPATALVNRGVGGVGTAGFSGALGKMRSPGTFSFVGGVTLFFAFATAAWFTILLHRRKITLGLVLSGMAIVFACPVSISRSLVLGCAIVFLFGLVALFRAGRGQFGLALRLSTILIIVGMGLSYSKLFKEGSAAFADRWTTAATQGGGVGNAVFMRFFDDITTPIRIGFDAPFFGYGIGIGSNFGAKMILGRNAFIAGEGELSRMVMENGLVIGWAFIIWRFLLTLYLGRVAWQALQSKNGLPFVIFAAVFLPFLMGQWSQPTALGFACFVAGLVLAAARVPVISPSPQRPTSQPWSDAVAIR